MQQTQAFSCKTAVMYSVVKTAHRTYMPNMICLMGWVWLLMSVSFFCWALFAAVDTMTADTDLMPLPSGILQDR